MDRGGAVRVGIVCPYSLDVPGGVQSHVLDLARALIALGHSVSVIAPADDERADGDPPLPAFVTPAGRAVSVPYNGSVARITFGPVSYARVRRWLAEHTSTCCTCTSPARSACRRWRCSRPTPDRRHVPHLDDRGPALSAFARPINALMEKVTAAHRGVPAGPAGPGRTPGRRRGGDPERRRRAAVRHRPALPGYPRDGHTVGVPGRYDEPRKGMRGPARRAAPAGAGPARPAAARRRPRRPRRAAPRRGPGARRPARHPRAGWTTRRRRRRCARWTSTARPTPAARASGWCSPRPWRPERPCGQRPRARSGAVLSAEAPPEGSAPACCSRPATPAGSPPRSPRCSTTRGAGPPSVRRLAPAPPPFDWPARAADVLRVYRAAIAADPRRVPGRTAAGTR